MKALKKVSALGLLGLICLNQNAHAYPDSPFVCDKLTMLPLQRLAGKDSVSYSEIVTNANSKAGTVIPFDFNGDKIPDLAALDKTNNKISVFNLAVANKQTLSYTERSFTVPATTRSLTAGDVDGDGKPDLLTVDGNNLQVLFNNGAAAPTAVTVSGFQIGADVVTTGDYNGDGKLDIALANGFEIRTFKGNANRTIAAASTWGTVEVGAQAVFVTPRSIQTMKIADASAPQGVRKDIFLTGDYDGFLLTPAVHLRNTSTASAISFQMSQFYNFESGVSAVAMGNFNGDGSDEGWAILNDTRQLKLFQKDASGTTVNVSTTIPAQGTAFPYSSIVAAELPSVRLAITKYSDLAVLNSAGNAVTMYNSAMNFSPSVFSTGAGSNPIAVAMSDVDQDGNSDLFFANNGTGANKGISFMKNVTLRCPAVLPGTGSPLGSPASTPVKAGTVATPSIGVSNKY